ncbi:MAG TPA: sulfatase-like hydrolase/transferase [Longimicrobiales bacterium]
MSATVRESIPVSSSSAKAQAGAFSLRSLLFVTVWCALFAGLAETATLAAQRQLLHRVIYRSDQYLWMPSVGALIVFCFVALLFWTIARVWPRVRTQRSALIVMVSLALFSVLMVTRWLHPLAAALLACGAAVMLTGRPDANAKLARVMRTTSPVLVALLLVLTLISTVWPRVAERRAIGRLPQASSGAPNILFLILDTVRARSLSLYGYHRSTTPNLDRLAGRGVVFERAIAPAPWTLPSHASMFTGMPPQRLSADRFAPLDATYPTLAEALARHGYVTGGFVANLAYASYEFGLERGFDHWNDYPISLAQILSNSSLGRLALLEGYSGGRNSWPLRVLGVEQWVGHTRTAADINEHLLDWASRQSGRPYFVFANYFDTHMPYLPPQPYLGSFGPLRKRSFSERMRAEGPGKWPRRGKPVAENALRDRYEESIRYLDAQVGRLMEGLRTRGLLENTIVVIASDHGEEFGENGAYEHDTGLSFSQVHVPLIIIDPRRVPQGVRVAQPVGLGDLAATILQLSVGDARPLAGHSLAPLWSGNLVMQETPVFSILEKRRKSQASIVTTRYQYIRQRDGEQLYDHLADVNETHDLSRAPESAAVLQSLRAELLRNIDLKNLR